MLLLACARPAEYVAASCDPAFVGSLTPGATWTYDGGAVVTLDEVDGPEVTYGGTFVGCSSTCETEVTYGKGRMLTCGEQGLYLRENRYEWWLGWDRRTFDPPVLLVPEHPRDGEVWEVTSVVGHYSDYVTEPSEAVVTGEVIGTEAYEAEGETVACTSVRISVGDRTVLETCHAAGIGVVFEAGEQLIDAP